MLFCLSDMISSFGSAIANFAMMWWILDTTGSPLKMGMIGIITVLINLLTSPFIGTYVDKLRNPIKMLCVFDIINAICMALIAMLIFYNVKTLLFYYVLIAVHTLTDLPFKSAKRMLTQLIIKRDHVLSASALNSFCINSAKIIGPAFGGILVVTCGPFGAIIIDACSYIISAIMKARIQIISSRHTSMNHASSNYFNMLKEGVLYLLKNRTVLYVNILCALTTLFTGALGIVVMVYIQKELQLPANVIGIASSAIMGGVIIASIFFSMKEFPKNNQHHLFIISFFLAAIFLINIGLSKTTIAIYAYLFLFGCFCGFVDMMLEAYILRSIPNTVIGRVTALFSSINRCLIPLSIFIFTLAMNYLSCTHLLMIIGLGIIVLLPFFYMISGFNTFNCSEVNTRDC